MTILASIYCKLVATEDLFSRTSITRIRTRLLHSEVHIEVHISEVEAMLHVVNKVCSINVSNNNRSFIININNALHLNVW